MPESIYQARNAPSHSCGLPPKLIYLLSRIMFHLVFAASVALALFPSSYCRRQKVNAGFCQFKP